MFFYGILLISFCIIALIIRVKRSVFYSLAENSVALVNELLTDVDDDEKIKIVQKSTNKLVYSLLKLFLLIILAFAAGSLPIIIYCLLSKTAFNNLNFSSFYSVLFISIGATIPFVIPIGKKQTSDYSELSQLLHRMALNNYVIGDKLFKKESKKITKRNLIKRNDFVIISGLARAGTTSLMNYLAKIDDFKTLNYANMPFLMCPNIWKKFYKPKNNQLKERSHKDGIMIGLNSNEALEEYFFKVKANDSYIKDTHLLEYSISEEDYSDYIDYQSIIKLDNNKIYLAKNNNFLLRYKSIQEFNKEFLMVILYRDPLTHAASLMEKHHEYKILQEDDPFVLEYMNWLGHHEFGINQKPFMFNNSKPFINNKESIDYWLESWINYYQYALSLDNHNTLFINYDSFCTNPKKTIEQILQNSKIKTKTPDYAAFVNKRKTRNDYSEAIYAKALEIFNLLKNK